MRPYGITWLTKLLRRPTAIHNGLEDKTAVAATQEGFAAAFRMGHHPQNIALVVQDSRNVVRRPVGIIGVRHGSVRSAVPEQYPFLLLQPAQRSLVREVIAFTVGNRYLQHLARLAAAAESRVGPLGPEIGPLASVLQVLVAPQDPGEKASLAENLKPIADADYQPAGIGEVP